MISIEIPDEIAQNLRLPPQRVKALLEQEVAVHLVREGICTMAQGARLAGMQRLEFEHLLGERNVAWPGTLADVQDDLRNLTDS